MFARARRWLALAGLWSGLAGGLGCAWAWSPPVAVDPGGSVQDVTARTDYWVDTSGQLDAAAVATLATSLPFQPASATQTHRLGEGALWQRLVIAPLPAGERWYLQVSFHGVDTVGLFYRGSDGQWVGQRAGDHLPQRAPRPRDPIGACPERLQGRRRDHAGGAHRIG